MCVCVYVCVCIHEPPPTPLQDGLERLSDAAVLKNNRALEDVLTAATEEAVSECPPRGWGGVHTEGVGWGTH